MRSNRKHTTEELERYIQFYLEEGKSYRELKKDYGLLLAETTFGQNVLRYLEHGMSGIQSQAKNNTYSRAFKETVVQEHLQEGVTLSQLARKYQIPQVSTVRRWVIRYTGGEEIRNYIPKPEVYTMTGKKTTQEERIEIVKDYLVTGLSYKDTAEKHGVSYNNVYAWVQKYKDHGPAGLADGRGRGKPNAIQTAEEKLRTENMALKARNQYLEAENAALKKLEEMERELILRKRGMKRSTKQSRSSKKKGSK